MTNNLPGFDDGVIAQARNRIVALQSRRGMNSWHKVGSLNKYLGARKLSDCEDIDALLGYEKHLLKEIENERKDDNTE